MAVGKFILALSVQFEFCFILWLFSLRFCMKMIWNWIIRTDSWLFFVSLRYEWKKPTCTFSYGGLKKRRTHFRMAPPYESVHVGFSFIPQGNEKNQQFLNKLPTEIMISLSWTTVSLINTWCCPADASITRLQLQHQATIFCNLPSNGVCLSALILGKQNFFEIFSSRLWIYLNWNGYSYCIEYCNDPKFTDRYTWANSADPDQT